MGLGRFGGGVDVAKFACKAGAKVIVADLASAEQLSDSIKQLEGFPDIEYRLGSHNPADFEQADIIVANPAVPNDNKFLEIARRAGRIVTSQINIFFELCPATIIGITGANGKSTTTALTAHLLKAVKNRNVWLGGNIGNEPLLTILDQIKNDDLVVLELSSFQIEQLACDQKAPQVALLTNLMPNHLDRYGSFENYCAAKENIFKFQRLDEKSPAVSMFNAEDPVGCRWFEKYRSQKGRICVKFSADDVSEQIRQKFALPGRANLSNLAAALAVAQRFGIAEKTIKHCLPKFKALPHRLELVAEINGIRWYNDSKATTPESTIVALDAFECPEIIIAGGYDKHLPFDELGKKIAQRAKAAILIGQTAEKIKTAIKKATVHRDSIGEETERKVEVKVVNSLAKAVELSQQLAVSGDVVLLSPACASYDMFENFEHRGREFTRLVQKISQK